MLSICLMNYKYNTSMLPRVDLMRVCLSCWQTLPSYMTRKICRHKYPGSTQLTCSGQCGIRWLSSLQQREFSSSTKSEDIDISKNPFYEKYQCKLQHLQVKNPEQFKANVEQIKQQKHKVQQRREPELHAAKELPKPFTAGLSEPKTWPPKSLDEILKIDLVKDLPAEAIKCIWQEHHLAKDCVFSVVLKEDYKELTKKSVENPVFLFPLPKEDGYEFYLCQFNGKDVYFTSLALYQLVKENAPPCLTIAHFLELKDTKGIVLMAGEYDNKVIKKSEALNLVKQMTLFYGKDAGDRYKLLWKFNKKPELFQYMDVVEQYKTNKEFLESNPY